MRTLVLSVFLLLVVMGCGKDKNDPAEYIDQAPAFWGEEDCQGGLSVKAGPITGYTSTGGYLWAALVRNGQLYKAGNAIYIDAGSFTVGALWVGTSHLEIPEGLYEYHIYLTIDSNDVGDITRRDLEAGPMYYSLEYGSAADTNCVKIIQGDSVYFVVVTDGYGYKSIEVWDSSAGSQGYAWSALLNGDSLDNRWLVQLNANGLYFPLKVTDNNEDLRWIINAVKTSSPYNVVTAEVVVNKPARLGSQYNAYDDQISYWANVHAVPVAILKGLVDKESNKVGGEFDTSSYRYEPFTVDFAMITYNTGPLNPSALWHTPYNKYHMGIPEWLPWGPMAAGTLLVAADTMPAVLLYGAQVQDQNGDGYLSANEYLAISGQGDSWEHTIPEDSDFVAQTTIASSYGMAQLLWSTAVAPMAWNGGNGGNPHYLFHPDLILNLGAKYLRSRYLKYRQGNWYMDWRNALAYYNDDAGNYPYADDILINLVNLYQPQGDKR